MLVSGRTIFSEVTIAEGKSIGGGRWSIYIFIEGTVEKTTIFCTGCRSTCEIM
jgi:hypothetical protein